MGSVPGPLPRSMLEDQTIRLTSVQAVKDCPHELRRVVVWDEMDRWEMELYFKALKHQPK